MYNSEDDAEAGRAAVGELSEEERALGYFSVRDGQALKVSEDQLSFTRQFIRICVEDHRHESGNFVCGRVF